MALERRGRRLRLLLPWAVAKTPNPGLCGGRIRLPVLAEGWQGHAPGSPRGQTGSSPSIAFDNGTIGRKGRELQAWDFEGLRGSRKRTASRCRKSIFGTTRDRWQAFLLLAFCEASAPSEPEEPTFVGLSCNAHSTKLSYKLRRSTIRAHAHVYLAKTLVKFGANPNW